MVDLPKITNAEIEYGEIWGLQNGDPKLETSKGRDNKKSLSKLEEEEKASPSELVSFLISKDITLDNALNFETRLLEEGLDGFTYEQVLDAIEWSLHQILEGNMPFLNPYTHTACPITIDPGFTYLNSETTCQPVLLSPSYPPKLIRMTTPPRSVCIKHITSFNLFTRTSIVHLWIF